MRAFVFPGQGSQYIGMGRDLYENHPLARDLFNRADKQVGFPITEIMFHGTEEDLKETKVTQPALFLHSVIACKLLGDGMLPGMVAGHSLGEFSALAVNGALDFEDALSLVSQRALAMQKACGQNPSTMAVVLGAEDALVEEVCASIDEVVVPANYNSPGQLVISGSFQGIDLAVEALKAAGVKRVLPLKVGGAFHSPLMESAREELAEAIRKTTVKKPRCPVYQNATALPSSDPDEIKRNLVAQLTAPVLWTKSVENMIREGATEFIEFGPGTVLQGLIKKIDPSVSVASKS